MDGGAWWATVHGVARVLTGLNHHHHTSETTLMLSFFFLKKCFIYLLSALYNKWNLVPRAGMKPVSLAVEGRVLTTGPPAKSRDSSYASFLHLLP